MKTTTVLLLAITLLASQVHSEAATILISGPTQSSSSILVSGSAADNNYGTNGLLSVGKNGVAQTVRSFQMSKTDPSGTKYTIDFADVSFFAGWISDASTNAGFFLSSPGLESIGAGPNFISTQSGLDSEKPLLTLVTIPEPGTIQLFVVGFLGIGLCWSFRRQTSAMRL